MSNWIPWTKGLPKKAEVARIASRMGVTRNDAAVFCMSVWEWADDQTVDGSIDGFSAVMVSDVVGIPGVGEAMVDVGWLLEDARGVLFPNWDYYNSNSAKKRMTDSKRQERHRRSCHGEA